MAGESRKKLQVLIRELRAKIETHSANYPINGHPAALVEWRTALDGMNGDVQRLLMAYGPPRQPKAR